MDETDIYMFADWLERHGLLKPPHEGPIRGNLTATEIARLYIAVDGESVIMHNGVIHTISEPKSTWPTPKTPVKGVEL